MEVGVAVYVRDKTGDLAWLEGTVHAKDSTSIVVRIDGSNEEQTFKIEDENADYPDVKLRNDPGEADVDNLINLPHLHEPAILFCLERRYSQSDIYTYTGPILIAVNPFKRVPLYTSQILEMYYNLGLLKSQGIENASPLPPHVYAIADAAYRDMMKVVLSNFGTNVITPADQSILISGESGAGKTESTKIVLRYLTTVGNTTGSMATETGSVMDKVLQSNPILEAFGNARTIRNDNSSRFGKFIELNFNKRGHLIGGLIRTYLLEKVRLPYQQMGERNFHIFYQMFSGGTAEDREAWHLGNMHDYYFVNQGNMFTLRHVNDADEFHAMKHALNILNFPPQHQVSLMRLMASVLHLGQLQFSSDGDEGSVLSTEVGIAEHMQHAAELCGISAEELLATVTIRIIVARDETYQKKLTPVQASDARDALCKALYGQIFQWIVSTINQSIQIDTKLIRSTISVLDIFGFECFQYNSFEQLCINYTNETLQQQFNQFIFKMEQIEYTKEKINWSFIEFPDNQDCLDLIEHKQNGIIAMLDDECRLPKASDEKFANRMYKSLAEHVRFSATAPQKRNNEFCIHHYAGPVIYSTNTFVEKNKDEVPKEAVQLFQGAKDELLAYIFSDKFAEDAEKATATPAAVQQQQQRNARKSAITKSASTVGSGKASVGAQFKEQLHLLMEKIYSTTPHYIRCLKPNDENVPDAFHRLRTTEQLRYGGVLEAVRVARSGFPVRLSHIEFYIRYRPLANPYAEMTPTLPRIIHKNHDPLQMCEKLLTVLWDETLPEIPQVDNRIAQRRNSRIADMQAWKGKSQIAQESIQLGITKVFLRKQAHDILEARRSRRLLSAVKKIQSLYRAYKEYSWYNAARSAAQLIQRMVRGMLARHVVHEMRITSAAIRIQTAFRCCSAYFRYTQYLYAVIRLQACYRGLVSRRQTTILWLDVKSRILQYAMRTMVIRHHYCRYRSAIIALQCALRRRVAKNILRARKAEARDLGKLQQNNESLKKEIEMLRQQAIEENKRIEERMRQMMLQKQEEKKVEEHENLLEELENTKKLLQQERNKRVEVEQELEATKRLMSAHAPKFTNDDYKQLQEQLQQEKVARQALEDELVRVRQMAVDKEHHRQPSSGDISDTASTARRLQEESMPKRRASGSSRVGGERRSSRKEWDDSWDVDSDESETPSVSVFSDDVPTTFRTRRTSFTGYPAPSDYQRKIDDVAATPTQKAIQTRALLGTFERNLESFKNRLEQGIRVVVYESQKQTYSDAILKLTEEDNISTITFVSPQRRFSLFAAKIDIKPIKVSEIIECFPGAQSDALRPNTDDSCYLTVVVSTDKTPRTISLILENRNDRNTLMTGLRTLISDIHISASTIQVSNEEEKGNTPAKVSRRGSFKSQVIQQSATVDASLNTPVKPRIKPGQKPHRRASSGSIPTTPAADSNIVDFVEQQKDPTASEVKRQLLVERSNYERLMVQMLVLTNDLNEREDQIIALKKRGVYFEEQLAAKEKMYEQDALVRMQLGKRLEQVLMDKEEIKDELDTLKSQLEMLKAGLVNATTPVK